MHYSLSIRNCQPVPVQSLGTDFSGTDPAGNRLSINSYYVEQNGQPCFPVSGEFHFSRMHEQRWEDELIKMRMGGITIVSTYVFWNHIEEDEGVFDFSGRRNLRRFLELCAQNGLQVILRIGPFAHGEARNGGLPDWLYGKPFEVRSTDPGFMACVRRLYAHIAGQVHGMLYRDGGPVIGIQLDNEYMHSSAVWEMTTGISDEWIPAGSDGDAYILALREEALRAGLAPVFFTCTAWGGAACPPQVLPLWGGYAYRPWLFYRHTGEHPATEEYIYEDYHHNGSVWADDFSPAYEPESRPYACCEMGAGMMCSYHYRFVFPYESVDALANIKLGSGCNFLGYYMFHGGTNPVGRHGAWLNEAQVSKLSYDYQAALGEFGQLRASYSRLKCLHLFTRSFGNRLAPMATVLPEGASGIRPEDMETLRFAVRTDGESGFLFVNNFQDHRSMPARTHEEVCIEAETETYRFDLSIASGENAILPFHFPMDGILLCQADAQPVLRTQIHGRATYVFMIPEGMSGTFRFEDGVRITGTRECFTVSKQDTEVDVLLLSREEACHLFLLRDGSLILTDAALLEDASGMLRLETGKADNTLYCYPPDRLNGAEPCGSWGRLCVRCPDKQLPVNWKPSAPCRWILEIPEHALDGLKDARLQIDYEGDIGTLFLNNRMISDHFCNGATWEIGLMEHRDSLSGNMVLRIAPRREGAHVLVESAMAARHEDVDSQIASLHSVRIQPVYQIRL